MEYYTLQGAARYLSTVLSEEIDSKKLIDIILKNQTEIRLHAEIQNCYVAKFYMNKATNDVEIKRFSGIVRMPINHFSFDSEETINAEYAEVVEATDDDQLSKIVFPRVDDIESDKYYSIVPLHDQEIYKNRFVVMTYEDASKLGYSEIKINSKDLLIPQKDLLDFVEKGN